MFESIGRVFLEVVVSLCVLLIDVFFFVVVLLLVCGFLIVSVLIFVYMVGEFGVVLMVGGNIFGKI